MHFVDRQFQISFKSKANPEAVVCMHHARFTVITSRLIRMEYSSDGRFEDRASQVFWHRNQPVPEYKVLKSQEEVVIDTEFIKLRYVIQDNGFTRDNLIINLKNEGIVWHYGDVDGGNLLGTARTLDGANGRTKLESGLMSRNGWALIDDSSTLVFNNECWLERRNPGNVQIGEKKDLYFFAYGNDYKQCLKDYCKIAGKVALLPRWALGNWWSRYWEYSEDELKELMLEFQKHEIPLSVCILDMDWHIVKNEYHKGWTGYTWNKALFPDPKGFIDWLHENGLKTALNLHPALGIHPHEEQYKEMAQFMGIDPESKIPVEFDIADPKFAKAYFDILHHPLEKQGIDFWWMDWQQGNKTKINDLDPLWLLNHLHFYDLGRDGLKRRFVFSRWGGLGNHRYPIGFSGDTVVSWDSLAYQPYFTATASNVGYGWWSHDIGGHFRGKEDGELYARWVQFGVFSPIMRLHSSNNYFQDRRPWAFDEKVYNVTKDAMQMRHALIPYIYTMSWRAYDESELFIKPMYYENAENEEAYWCSNQYWFGSELVAAPFITPANDDTNLSRQVVWLPEGKWFNYFTGEYYQGGKYHGIYGKLQDIPVFAKEGAIIPLSKRVGWGGIQNPSEMEIMIFPGANNCFRLYEDDGETTNFESGEYCITILTQEWHDNRMIFRITAAEGNVDLVPQERKYELIFKGIINPDVISVKVNGNNEEIPFEFDDSSDTLVLKAIRLRPLDDVEVVISTKQDSLIAQKEHSIEKCTEMLKIFTLENETKSLIKSVLNDVKKDPRILSRFSKDMKPSQMTALLEVLFQGEICELLA